jgi:hypothetical protein
MRILNIALTVLILGHAGLAQYTNQGPATHRFWDNGNKALFLSHAALESVDFGITHRNLSSGGEEMDYLAKPLCEAGTAGQVAFFGGRIAGVLAGSYLFHRMGHHRLERLVPFFASADSSYGVAYSFANRSNRIK